MKGADKPFYQKTAALLNLSGNDIKIVSFKFRNRKFFTELRLFAFRYFGTDVFDVIQVIFNRCGHILLILRSIFFLFSSITFACKTVFKTAFSPYFFFAGSYFPAIRLCLYPKPK
jgi:hypothetical protein